MDDHHLRIYLNELSYQIEVIRLADNSYNLALDSQDVSGISTAFAATQSFLSAVAMISKILWPSPQPKTHVDGTPLSNDEKREAKLRAELRGEVLRRELGEIEIEKLNSLKGREVRNGLEHFDERLDQYLHEAGPGANIIDRNIMPPGSIIFNGNQEPLILRNIDPNGGVIFVLGDKANMQDLMVSVNILSNLCNDRLSATN